MSETSMDNSLDLQHNTIPKEIVIEYYKHIISEYDFMAEYKKLLDEKTYNEVKLKELVLASIYLLELEAGPVKQLQHLTSIQLRLENNETNPILEPQIAYFMYILSNVNFNKRESSLDKLHMYS